MSYGQAHNFPVFTGFYRFHPPILTSKKSAKTEKTANVQKGSPENSDFFGEKHKENRKHRKTENSFTENCQFVLLY